MRAILCETQPIVAFTKLLTTGRHLPYTPERPSARKASGGGGRTMAAIEAAVAIPKTNKLANVHLALLQAAGVPATSFGNGTGPI